jgi:hypothetical protein
MWTYRKINSRSKSWKEKWHVYRAPMDDSPIHTYCCSEAQAKELVNRLISADLCDRMDTGGGSKVK